MTLDEAKAAAKTILDAARKMPDDEYAEFLYWIEGEVEYLILAHDNPVDYQEVPH